MGRAGLYNPVRVDWPEVEVGWTLDQSSGGNGSATEARIAARDHCFGELGVERLYSCILPDNLASQAFARRLGFTLLDERTMAWYPDAPTASGWASGGTASRGRLGRGMRRRRLLTPR